MRKVIVNTTPLIALAGIGQLGLLRQLYTEVMIPCAVDCEIISEPARTLSLQQIGSKLKVSQGKCRNLLLAPDYIREKWK